MHLGSPDTLAETQAVWLMGGSVLGVVVRAVRVPGQSPFSRETVQDVFVSVVLAALWAYPLPGLSTIYPPFTFPPNAPAWFLALVMAGANWLFIDMAKGALLKWAPKAFEKYTGQPNGVTVGEEKKP